MSNPLDRVNIQHLSKFPKLIMLFREKSNLGEEGSINYDGRFLFPESEVKEHEACESYNDIIGESYRDIERKEVGMELDLMISNKEVRSTSTAICMRNIRKSAQTLFDEKLLYVL